MLNIVNQIVKALQIPYFVLLILTGSILFLSKRKFFYLFFIIVSFMVLWRMFFNISASRYCASFLLVLFCALPISLRGFRINAHCFNLIIFTLCMGFLGLNFLKLFSSFRDVYFLDLNDDMKMILFNNPNDVGFVIEKDYNRIRVADAPLFNRQMVYEYPPLSYKELTYFYNKYFDIYNYMTADSFFFIPQKSNENIPAKVENGVLTFKEIRHYRTNKKSSFYSVYHLPVTHPPLLAQIDEIKDPDLKGCVRGGVLKVYEPYYDTYVFQIGNKLVWLIGSDIKDGTELVYHIFTDVPELLPVNRIQHGFDNRSFRFNAKKEHKKYGKYIVFEKDIPDFYPVTKIRVGFSMDLMPIWSRFFNITAQNS